MPGQERQILPQQGVALPAAVEWASGELYATIDVFRFVEGQEEPIPGDGKVVMITP